MDEGTVGAFDTILTGINKVGKAIDTVAIAGGAAFVGMGKSALSSLADYQQLSGGIEKLFGSDAQSVIDNASKAFKTAGVSMNEYMQQVTGFSASLISSLGGDTAKAAQYADRIITDMADNANTFGTSLTSIQYAYQGFAKQNYTMLDNLRLGYGGTKEEMERLISDASKMKEEQQQLNVVVKEGDMSFGNIANAISVVQKKMNITGTTTREASQTISGSISQMKAAWQNLLTSIGTGNNFEQALNDFVDSVRTVANNIGPAIKQMAPRLTQAFIQVFQEIGPIIADVITDMFVGALKSIPKVISQTNSVTKAFIAMAAAIKGIQGLVVFVNLVNQTSKLITNMKALKNWWDLAGLALAKNTIETIADTAAKLANAVATGVATVAQMALNAAMAAAPYALVALLIAGLVAGLALLVKHLYEATDGFQDWSSVSESFSNMMGKIGGAIDNAIHKIHQFGKDTGITDAISNASQKINSFLGNINSKVANAISQVGSSIKNGLSSAIVNVGNRLSDMGQSFSNGFGNVVSTVSNAMNNIGQTIRGTASSFGNYASSGLSSLSSNFSNTLNNISSNISNWGSTISSAFSNTFNSILTSVSNWGSNMVSSASTAVNNMIDSIKKAFSNIANDFASIGANIVNGILKGFTNTWNNFVYKVKQGVEDVKKLFQSMFDIHSPSRWFKWIGEMCVAGFDEGFSDFGDNSLDNVNTKLNSTLGSVQASVSGGQVGLGGYTQIVNVNQQISTPDELARAIRNETRMGIMTGAYA